MDMTAWDVLSYKFTQIFVFWASDSLLASGNDGTIFDEWVTGFWLDGIRSMYGRYCTTDTRLFYQKDRCLSVESGSTFIAVGLDFSAVISARRPRPYNPCQTRDHCPSGCDCHRPYSRKLPSLTHDAVDTASLEPGAGISVNVSDLSIYPLCWKA